MGLPEQGLQHASKGHREEEGHAMDDIAQFLLDVQGATRFFKGLAVLDTIIRHALWHTR